MPIKKKKKSTPQKSSNATIAQEYVKTLHGIKEKVEKARVKSALAANKELILLYWEIGAIVSEKQEMSNWGSNIIERLAQDLQN